MVVATIQILNLYRHERGRGIVGCLVEGLATVGRVLGEGHPWYQQDQEDYSGNHNPSAIDIPAKPLS
jgi:hypothetical protein